jgi:hypothetical protein
MSEQPEQFEDEDAGEACDSSELFRWLRLQPPRRCGLRIFRTGAEVSKSSFDTFFDSF